MTKVIMENDRSLTEIQIREAKKEKLWKDELKKLDLATKATDAKLKEKQEELKQMVQKHKQELHDKQQAENRKVDSMMAEHKERIDKVTRQMEDQRKHSEKEIENIVRKHNQELLNRQLAENDKMKSMKEENKEQRAQFSRQLDEQHKRSEKQHQELLQKHEKDLKDRQIAENAHLETKISKMEKEHLAYIAKLTQSNQKAISQVEKAFDKKLESSRAEDKNKGNGISKQYEIV